MWNANNLGTVLRKGFATSGGVAAITTSQWAREYTTNATVSSISSKILPPSSLTGKSRALWNKKSSSSHYLKEWNKRTFSVKSSNTSTPDATKVSSAPPKKSFMQWYEGHLNKTPILTKAVTGSILWGIGDAVAQLVPQVEYLTSGESHKISYDYPRTGRAVAFGGILHAPTSHAHLNFLEWMTIRSGLTGLQIPVFKTVMEQFVYWSWISNSMYHAAMGAMQGMSPQQIYDRIADILMDTQKAQWAFWIPVQLLNFNFVPVRHQLNVVLLTSIVWTALLSIWYPPITKEHPEASKPE